MASRARRRGRPGGYRTFAMRVLVVNAGSTSLKLRVVEPDDTVGRRVDMEAPGPTTAAALARFVAGAGPLDAVGHRVVHGGGTFTSAVRIDGRVRRALAATAALAPLHNPPALEALDRVGEVLTGVPAVACFDTSFHHDMPDEAAAYALPAEWVTRWGIRRFGFHGLNCEWVLSRAEVLLGRPAADLRLVVCHLGGGASVTAVAGGRSVDTTMGFTPTEGLVMASRSGDVDPGALTWLLAQGVTVDELSDGLERRSGITGLTGGRTGDMRRVLELRSAGDAEARQAVAVYLHRLRAKVAGAVASMGGVDAVAFTGGVGERSAVIRAEACSSLAWMGVALDPDLNESGGDADADLSAAAASVRVLRVAAREELVVAAHCRRVLAQSAEPRP